MLNRDDVTQKADSISRRHAVISHVCGRYYIGDGDGGGKKSRNKTYVNGFEVPYPQRRLLLNGDRIRICDFSCRFDNSDDDSSSVEASIRHDSSTYFLQHQTADKLKVILEISNSLSTTLDIDA